MLIHIFCAVRSFLKETNTEKNGILKTRLSFVINYCREKLFNIHSYMILLFSSSSSSCSLLFSCSSSFFRLVVNAKTVAMNLTIKTVRWCLKSDLQRQRGKKTYTRVQQWLPPSRFIITISWFNLKYSQITRNVFSLAHLHVNTKQKEWNIRVCRVSVHIKHVTSFKNIFFY